MTTPAHHDESERLAALRAYGILDTPPEAGFEHVTSVVTRLFNVPIAAVTLVDAERQWFKSVRGWDVCETPREVSFCAHAMMGDEVMVVADATLDKRFADNPLVAGHPGVRFYAGAPLRTPEGYPLGALCVLDHQPREFTRADRDMLAEMAALVEDELLLRRVANEMRSANAPACERESGPRSPSSRPGPGPSFRVQERNGRSAPGGDPAEGNRFRYVVEQANDAIFVYDLDGKFLDVNEAGCKMFGYPHEQLVEMHLADLEIGFDAVKGRKRWEQMNVGEATTMEGLNRRADGSFFWAEVKVGVVETDSGRQLVALVRDITQRKHAETTLQMRAQQQRAVAQLGVRALRGENIDDLLDEAVAAVGETLKIEVCRVLEHLPERAEFVTRAGLGIPDSQRGTPAAPDSVEFAAGYVLRTGEPVIVDEVAGRERFKLSPWLKATGALSGVHVRVGGDGSHSPMFGVLAAYTLENRVFTDDDVYFVQSVANVLAAAIARQRTDDALRIVEANYRRIAANTPGVVYQYLTRPDGSLAIPFISESCRALFGLGPAELRARPTIVTDLVHPEDRGGFKKAIIEAKVELTPLHWRGRIRLASGELKWVHYESKPERLPDGSVICDGMVVDVTEEETGKEALRQSEERSRLAMEEAEKANHAKSKFLSRMSHELRTPLNAILGFGQVMEFSSLGEQDAIALSYILKGGRLLLALIDEVLDLSRAENGELLLKPRQVDAEKTMRECMALVARLAEARNIVCTVKSSPRPVTLWCDEQRLRQVLLNLLSNAIKYNREGGRILVQSERIAMDAVRVKVSDSGEGIPAEELKRLFVPFERLGHETSGVEGTGLGLVVSQQIARAMGGSIGVESEVGRGSTFWIELPLAGGEEMEAGSASSDENGDEWKPGDLANGEVTLLYIEDNSSNLEVIQMLVGKRRPHWQFRSAKDGKSGLAQARKTTPDLILLDFQLPDMLGDEVLIEIRKDAATRQIPVVMLTADATAPSREHLLRCGADEYVSKPFETNTLLHKLDALLRKSVPAGQGN